MLISCSLVVTSLLAISHQSVASTDDAHWARWRGPHGTGYVAEGNPPTEWSEEKNIRWKTPLPGSGYASPIIHGDRLYLMTAIQMEAVEPDEAEGDDDARPPRGRGRRGFGSPPPAHAYGFRVLAINRNDGAIIWNTPVRKEVPHEGVHQTGSYAPGSPVTDGERIYAHFGSRGLYCLDLDGNVVWEKDLGNMQIRGAFGEGASPALHGDTLVVPWDHEGDSFVVALNKHDGEEIWRVPRSEPSTWATPVVTEVGDRVQVILPGTNNCISYDLETGNEVWRSEGLTANVIPTPVLGHGMVYLMSGFRGSSLLAVDLSRAKGDISDTDAIVWRHNRATPYVPSPMLAGERLYFLGSNNGILSCFNALTGEAHYAGERLDNVRNVYSSIIGANGYVFVFGREGECAVIADDPEFRQIRTNSIDEGINATPAIVGDVMYLRGDDHLYCIGRPMQN